MKNKETIGEAKVNNLIKLFGKDFDLEPRYVIESCNDSFIEGAKWQEEMMYSEKDMINFTEWVIINYQNQYKLLTTSDKRGFYTTKELLIEWLEKYKKK